MNELNISSLIQIMQEGFVEHDKQESAGRFLLESVALQEDSLCTTDLNSKKISRLVNRKDPVPDDIKQAALKADIAVKVEEYFRQKVIPDINPYTKDDVFQKIMNVIIQDSEIAKRKKDEFQRLYDLGDDAYFLYSVFMYALQRNNRIIVNTVEYQDAPLLAEVTYECPLSHEKLVEEVKGIPKKKYEITQIFPDDLPQDLAVAFDAVYPKPIQERAKELAKKAEIIWPYPSIAEVELAPYQLAEKAVQKYSLETYDVNAFTRMLFEALDKRIMNLSPAVKKEYKKLYVAYKLDTNFVDIVFQKQRLRISINMKFSEIHDPNGICKDITGLGRWGNGDVELFMEHQDELDQIMEIVQQSFDAQAE